MLKIFMNFMNRVFKPYLEIFVVVFINNILFYSQSEEEHMRYLRVVLQTFREKTLFPKFKKSKFWLEEVVFLGYVVWKMKSRWILKR